MYLFTYFLKKTKCHCPEGKACVYGLNVLCSKVHISNVVSRPVSYKEEMGMRHRFLDCIIPDPFQSLCF